jgi:hypothetical protein
MYQNMLEGLLTQFVDVFDNTDSLKTSLNLQAGWELTNVVNNYVSIHFTIKLLC